MTTLVLTPPTTVSSIRLAMINKQLLPATALLFLAMLGLPQVAVAVVPPDLVVSAGAQVVGIFSLLAAVIVSFIAGLGMLYLTWYQWFKKWSTQIAFGVLAAVLVGSNAVFLMLLLQPSQTVVVPVDPEPAQSAADCQTCQFYSDSITLFVPDADNPLVIEMNLNRRQEPDKTFTHYYFLNGLINTRPIEQYIQSAAANRDLQTEGFLQQIERREPADASVRAIYTGQLETESGQSVQFTTAALSGDFVTRNTPEYTQLQSALTAEVIIDGTAKPAYALVETLQSIDYEKSVFFPGYADLDALTYQFVLWDAAGNFYMIDQSEVFSDTAAYPDHSWLLYKEAGSGLTKKGFASTISQPVAQQWQITLPDFKDGLITVSTVHEYKNDAAGSSHQVVSGQLVDQSGERTISGILRIVQ